jgi:ketol-acid reductoisomerase
VHRWSAALGSCRHPLADGFFILEELPMPATMYYDQDADLGLLKGKTIAIIGYGSQGHAQAQNLRDSGCDVVVGQRPGSPNYELAVKHGFKPVSAAEAGDLVNILLPDEVQADVYTRGPRIITEQTRAEMRKILNEIQTGQFAREWIMENKAGRPVFNATRRRERNHPVEQVGTRLRSLMSWIEAKTVRRSGEG